MYNKGLYYTKRASAYGVTVSYLPTFANLEILLTGNPNDFCASCCSEDVINGLSGCFFSSDTLFSNTLNNLSSVNNFSQ